ncbi:12961_t:CDS:1, partial [Dentiscutata heterogama]
MPKKNNKKNICILRCSSGFTISIVGDIKASILLYKNLEKLTNRIKADRATILLERSDKKYNLYTTFELNQVIYHKTFNVLSAKNGSGETMKSSATDLNTKREKVKTYEQMANP